MPVYKADPRTYVQQIPLPVSSQKGLKIQARNIDVYNPTVPARNEVRVSNYIRRMQQMSQQGFKSVSYKPYQGIGDPFYLDEKKLILHALGQWNESHEAESSSSSEEEDTKDNKNEQLKEKPRMTAAKFVLKRSRKDLNTLNKEVVHGRKMVRNVKLGHGLFDLIKQERLEKKAAADAEYKKKMELARNMQPPKYDSSSDDDLDEFTDDDLANYMDEQEPESDEEGIPVDKSSTSPDESPRVNFSGMGLSDLDSGVPTPRPTSTSSRRKKQPLPRPYTPQHTNILETTESVSKDSLFRQLCVLNWILEAMAADNPAMMTHVTSCWKLTDIGGSRYPTKKIQRDKAAEKDWADLLEKHASSKGAKRSTGGLSSKNRMSVRRPWQSSRGTATLMNTFGTNQVESISEDMKSVNMQENEEDARTTSIFEFLNASYGQQEKTGNNISLGENQRIHDKRKKERRMNTTEIKSSRKSSEPIDTRPHTSIGQNEEKRSSRMLRADYILRPKSSPGLIEYQAKLPSNRRSHLPEEMQKKFAEVKEDKSLNLHDILEQMERQRHLVCQNKFTVMQQANYGCSFHQAVYNMRMDSAMMLSKPTQEQIRKKNSMKSNWYTDLLDNIPYLLRDEWFYKVIIEKLAKFGLMEGSGKSSVYKFLLVVESLRPWELCSPDVSAAIEFVREKVVSMAVEDYEEWFQHTFPKITRPQTAPPSKKNRERSSSARTPTAQTGTRPMTTRSAVVYRSQR
ncbi:hypothetical protein ScPMuIL_007739 [Solemya velum]